MDYIGIKPKHCEKCGRDYTPVIFGDECPHSRLETEQDKELFEPILNVITGAITTNISYPKGLTWRGTVKEIIKVARPILEKQIREQLGEK